ncbi:hypothetical protein J4233_02385 [Candidatus Pacearchaeota archaeon]|nr:hypothetical protein [Candidatus Pacearchaeota archaeon]
MAKKRNWKVVVLNLLALVCVVLTFTINWMFVILAAIFSGIGWKVLMKGEKISRKGGQ